MTVKSKTLPRPSILYRLCPAVVGTIEIVKDSGETARCIRLVIRVDYL